MVSPRPNSRLSRSAKQGNWLPSSVVAESSSWRAGNVLGSLFYWLSGVNDNDCSVRNERLAGLWHRLRPAPGNQENHQPGHGGGSPYVAGRLPAEAGGNGQPA